MMLFAQSAGGFFAVFILSRLIFLRRLPTAAEVLLCCFSIVILWTLRQLVQRLNNDRAR